MAREEAHFFCLQAMLKEAARGGLMGYGRVFAGVLALGLLLGGAITESYASHIDKNLVLFINPGKAQESFWGDVDGMMAAAGAQLGLRLEVFHAERKHYRMAEFLAERLKRAPMPDYVVLVNEKQVGTKLLQLLYSYPIPVLFILNDITWEQRVQLSRDPHWLNYLLPAVVPNNGWIGYQTMARLLSQGAVRSPQVIMMSGDKVTPASIERDAGAQEVLHRTGAERLLQQVYGQWDEYTAYTQMQVLLRRYPQLTHVWTANDHMAFGVLRALEEVGRTPGKDVWLSSINTSEQVLQLRQQGRISVLGGGHFVAGALGLLLIDEHRHGEVLPSVSDLSFFALLEPDAPLFHRLLLRQWRDIEFKRLKRQPEQLTHLEAWLH